MIAINTNPSDPTSSEHNKESPSDNNNIVDSLKPRETSSTGDCTPVQDEPRFDEQIDDLEKLKANIEAVANDDNLEAAEVSEDGDDSEPDIEVKLGTADSALSLISPSDELILNVSGETISPLDPGPTLSKAPITDVASSAREKSDKIESAKFAEESTVELRDLNCKDNSENDDDDIPPLDPKSSISLDCDDILNFDFEDLNDLDSFLDKHTSVDKDKMNQKENGSQEEKNEESTVLDDIQQQKPNKAEKDCLKSATNVEPKQPDQSKPAVKKDVNDQPKTDNMNLNPSKTEDAPRMGNLSENEVKSKPKQIAKREKIVYSAPGSPSQIQASGKTQEKSASSLDASPEKPKRILNLKEAKSSPSRSNAHSKRDAKLMESLDKELEMFHKGLAKIQVPVKEDKKSKRKPIEYSNLDLGSSSRIDSNLFQKKKPRTKSRSKERKEVRVRRRSDSREKLKHRKRRKSSTTASESSESYFSSDEESNYNSKQSDLETITSASSEESDVSEKRGKKKRKAKSDRERRKKYKADERKKLSRDAKSRKRPNKDSSQRKMSRKKRSRESSNGIVSNDDDDDDDVPTLSQKPEKIPKFSKTIQLSQDYEDFSDDSGDPYAHLKPSSDVESGSSTTITASFRQAAENNEELEGVNDFDEDDDIFKIADVEKNRVTGSKTSKKLSHLEQLKLKHRNQVSYSDEEYTNEDEEIESLIRAPGITKTHNSDLSSKLGRKVTVQSKSSKRKAEKIEQHSQSNSEDESISSKSNYRSKNAGLNVKDRLTLTTKLKKSNSSAVSKVQKGSSMRSADTSQGRSVHSRLGNPGSTSRNQKEATGRNSTHNSNTALTRLL